MQEHSRTINFERIKVSVVTKLQWLCDKTVRKQLTPRLQLAEMLVIKYFYMFLTVLILGNKWYQGYGSYGVVFALRKEFFSSAAFVAIWLLFHKISFSGSFLKQLTQCLFVLYYVPLNSAFSINDTSWSFFILSNSFFALIMLAVWGLSRYTETKWNWLQPEQRTIEQTYDRNPLVSQFCFIACCVFIIHKLSFNGLKFSLSIFGDFVYSNRATYQEYLDRIAGTPFSYILAIVRYLISYIVPFYLLSSLLRKKPLVTAICILCALSMYAVSSEKSKLLMPVVVVMLYILYRLDLLKNFDRVFSCGIILLMVICLLEHVLLRGDRIFTLIIRREMYLPAWLNTLYYDFFSKNDKVLWTQSVFLLQNIFEPVYDTSPLELISNAYFQGLIPSPNTGMFAEAYMHFGVLGVFIYPILFAAVFVLSDRVLHDYGNAVQILLAVQVSMSLSNVPMTRTDFVLSFGLFMMVLFLLPRLNSAFIMRERKQ